MEAFDENIFIEFYDELDDIKEQADEIQRQIASLKTSGDYTEDIGKLCRQINTIIKWQEYVTNLGSLISRLNEIMSYCVRYASYYLSQIVMKYVELIALYIKKITLNIRLFIAKASKNVVKAIANGKGPAIASAIASGALAAMMTMAQVLNVVLQAIQMVLNMFVGPLSISAEAMCFFMTPKTIMTGQMKSDIPVTNVNVSITDYLPEPIKLQIENIALAVNQANVPIKVSFIAASAALGAGLALSGTEIKIDPCVELKEINLKDIISAIETILTLSINPQPLPKFEKLLPTNIGFMLFLMTGFNSGGKLAFGLPGFP